MDLDYLRENRIIWKTSPEFLNNETYLYFPQGKDSYRLFSFNYKISSLKQLIYHFVVLRYLNEKISRTLFKNVCLSIVKSNAFTTDETIKKAIDDAYDLEEVPKTELRKFFFNPKYKLNQSERMKIISGITQSPSISEEDIYKAIGELRKSGIKITASRIAVYLDVSRVTLYKHLTDILKQMIKYSE